jgi:hypothetical protein
MLYVIVNTTQKGRELKLTHSTTKNLLLSLLQDLNLAYIFNVKGDRQYSLMLKQIIKICVFQRWDYGKTVEKSAELDLICLNLKTLVQRIILLLYHQVPFHQFTLTTCYNIHYSEILICTWLSFPLDCYNNFRLITVLHGRGARIAQSVYKLASDWMVKVWFPEVGDFSLLYSIHTVSGAHPSSRPMGTEGYFPRSEVTRAWSWPIMSIQWLLIRLHSMVLN